MGTGWPSRNKTLFSTCSSRGPSWRVEFATSGTFGGYFGFSSGFLQDESAVVRVNREKAVIGSGRTYAHPSMDGGGGANPIPDTTIARGEGTMKSRQHIRFRHFALAVVIAALAFAGAHAARSQEGNSTTNGKTMEPQSPVFTVVSNYPPGPLQGPYAQALVQGRNGQMYTTNVTGIVYGTTPSGVFTNLLGQVGGAPDGGVTLGADGYFYGTNTNAGNGNNGCGNPYGACGQIYKVSPTGVETILYTFQGFDDGCGAFASPIEATNGKFYGVTKYTGIPGQDGSCNNPNSTMYSITSSGTYTTIHTFNPTEGQAINAALVQGTDGNFYGVANSGGANSCYGQGYCGTIFKITPSGTVTVLHNFDGADGQYPAHALIQASDGNFYGVTSGGGAHGDGVVFQITPSGVYADLHDLDAANGDGEGPNGPLIQATDGNLYGVTEQGTAGFNGTVFSITTSGTFTTLYTFCSQANCTDGVDPATPLIQHTDGKLYGNTYTGGNPNQCGIGCGVFFSLDVGLGPFVSLLNSSGKEGSTVQIMGQGFTHATTVSFNGTPATIIAGNSTILGATVPSGATTGNVTVTTGSTTLTSNQVFRVTPVVLSFSPPSGPVGTSV